MREDLSLQPHEKPAQGSLVPIRVMLPGVREHVVDVLDEDDFSVQAIQVLEEGPVPARPEDQPAPLVPKRPVFHVNGDGIRRGVLDGKLYL